MTSYVDNNEPLRIGIDGMVTSTERTGVGRYFEALTQALNEVNDNIELTVYLGSNQSDLVRLLPQRILIRQSLISTEQSLLNFFRQQLLLAYFCKKHHISVLHIPNEKLILFKRCPVVITIHDVGDFRISKRISLAKHLFRRIAMPITLRSADHIIAVSERTKRDLIELFQLDKNKITVIYEGIAKEFYKKPNTQEIWQVRHKFNIRNDFILFVGEINQRKNIKLLINAFRAIELAKIKNMLLVIVGKDGNAKSDIQKLIYNYNLHDRIILTGHISDRELSALYYSAYSFVLPSLYEGFGLPVLEAMACGLPVISSNAGSLPELIGDAGLIVDCKNSYSLSEAIFQLINDKYLHSKLRSKGLERSKKFSWNNCALETLKIYQRVIK